MRADLDTLVIVLYCAACALFPSERTPRRGRPEKISDNELLALMVAQMLLQCPSDRGSASCPPPARASVPVPARSASRYNERCRALTPKLVLLWKAIAAETLGGGGDLRLLDTTPLPCGQSVQTTRTSQLAPWAGFGYCPAHPRRYWGLQARAALRPRRHNLRLRPRRCQHRRTAGSARAAGGYKPDRRRHDRLRQRLRRRRVRSRRTGAARAALLRAKPSSTSPTALIRRSAGSGNGSNRSSTPSKTSCCSNTMAAAPLLACVLARVTARILALCACIHSSTNNSDTTAANSPPTPINRSTI